MYLAINNPFTPIPQNDRQGGGASKQKEKAAKSNESRREQGEWASSSESEADSDDETSKILESGGRDKCAYFFWQGMWVHAGAHEPNLLVSCAPGA